MTPDEFSEALKQLSWKQIDFCLMAGLNRSTPSRWMTQDAPIPDWVPKFLGMALEIKRLHEAYVLPPKKSKKTEG